MHEYQHRIGSLSVEAPGMGAAPLVMGPRFGASNDDLVAETAVEAPIAVGYVVGGLVGAALVGAGIGYVASGRQHGAITGAVAGVGVSATTTALSELFYGRKMFGVVSGVAAVGALVYAWFRKPKG
jgi:hypothetical protein